MPSEANCVESKEKLQTLRLLGDAPAFLSHAGGVPISQMILSFRVVLLSPLIPLAYDGVNKTFPRNCSRRVSLAEYVVRVSEKFFHNFHVIDHHSVTISIMPVLTRLEIMVAE
jgi:hypothetical protein